MLLVAGLLVLGTTGCRYMRDDKGLFVDARDDYLNAAPAEPLVVPEDLSAVRVADTWPIPDLANPNAAAKVFPKEAPRPEVLVGRDLDAVKIQKLGTRSWMVLGDSPAQVWPLLKQFLADNGVGIGQEDPPQGVIESEWIVVADRDYADVVRSAIRDGRAKHVEGGGEIEPGRDRLRFRVERGIRRGSSEVHISHVRADGLSDTESPAVPEVETEVITEVAEYFAAGITQAAVSMVGRDIAARSKADIIKDDGGYPALYLNVGFDRAWATVGQALERAEIVVQESDAEGAVVRAVFPTAGRRGWLKRIVPGGESGENTRVVIRVERNGEGRAVVSVEAPDGDQLATELAEEVLITVREFAA